MKLKQLVENEGIFASMLLKLVGLGEPVYVNAKGKTFLTGNERMGYEAKRSNHKGWVMQYDRVETPPDTPVKLVSRMLRGDILNTSTYFDGAMKGTGPHSGSLFQFEKPIEQNYTIKKIDGVWTIVDREPVTESKKDEHEHDEFMLRQAAKKMVAVGLKSEVVPAVSDTKGPYIKTPYASFSIHTYFDGDPGSSTKWFNAWFLNGRREGSIISCRSVDEVIKDIL